MVRFLHLLFFILPLGVHAQFTYVIDQSIPVQNSTGDELQMPWAGGLNAAHHNTMDLNNDGKDDLVIFDRTADKVITFLNDNNQYRYAPDYENFFPSDITNWLLLRDFNCDGKKDIFTGNSLGIKVYLNVTTAGENLSWEHFLFYTGLGDGVSPVLLTKGFTSKVNLQLQFDDLPSIMDADGDGDLDIFNMRFVGNGIMEYHQNFSVERYGTCDSLDFERQTQNWGGFTECNCGTFAFNGSDCPPSTGGRTKHAGGKSLLVLDMDGDADLDVLFSEASCSNLYLLENVGTTSDPVINTAINFPAGAPLNFSIFPAAFYEDLDFDNKKDLVAIPNIFSKTLSNSNLAQSNWFYKNTGSTSSPVFNLTKRNFLQEHMIDGGDNSVPAFIDYDGDGDYDLFLSRNTSEDQVATIMLFENRGTADAPEFALVNDDMWQFSLYFFYNLKIQFVDVNGDTKTDLAFTATSYQNGSTRLYYVLNKGTTSFDIEDQSIQDSGFVISFSENIFITDVNKDGHIDLLVGKSNGSLQYWRNKNQDGALAFSLDDDSYLGLGQTVLRQNISCTASDLDGNGKTDLILGDQAGTLSVVSNFREATDATGAFNEIIFNALSAGYESQNLGGHLWPATVNLFGTTKPAIVTGNVLGGLTILRHDEGESLPSSPLIEVYPNPLPKQTAITIKIDRPATLQLFSMLGQQLTEPAYLPASEELSYKVPVLAAGVYIFRFTINNQTFIRRVVIY